jgi:uncharacterized membrane protein (UPF0127 family)
MHVIINGHIFTTKIANSPKEIAIGMMNSTFDNTFDSMLFVLEKKHFEPVAYNSEKKYNNKTCFWMKNCIIPLDMIFIKNKMIQQIFHSSEPCPLGNSCKSYCGFADYVLEVQGGTCKSLGFSIGNIVQFTR